MTTNTDTAPLPRVADSDDTYWGTWCTSPLRTTAPLVLSIEGSTQHAPSL